MVKLAIKRIRKMKQKRKHEISRKHTVSAPPQQNPLSILAGRFGIANGSNSISSIAAGNTLNSLVQSNQSHANDTQRLNTEIDAYKKKEADNKKEAAELQSQLRAAKKAEEKSQSELQMAKIKLEDKDKHLRNVEINEQKRKSYENQIAEKERQIHDIENKTGTAELDRKISQLEYEKQQKQRLLDDNVNYSIYLDKKAKRDRLKAENDALDKTLSSNEFNDPDTSKTAQILSELNREKERNRMLKQTEKYYAQLNDKRIENASQLSPDEMKAVTETITKDIKSNVAENATLMVENAYSNIAKDTYKHVIDNIKKAENDRIDNIAAAERTRAEIDALNEQGYFERLDTVSKQIGQQNAKNDIVNEQLIAQRNFRQSKLKGMEMQSAIDAINDPEYKTLFDNIDETKRKTARIDKYNKALQNLQNAIDHLNEKKTIQSIREDAVVNGDVSPVDEAVYASQFADKRNSDVQNHIDTGMKLKNTVKIHADQWIPYCELNDIDPDTLNGPNILDLSDEQINAIGNGFVDYVDDQNKAADDNVSGTINGGD